MSRKRAAGVDLGTTFSVAAWVDQTGRTALIENTEGDVLTPSVVLFEERAVVVGKEAKKAGVLRPGCVAECVKRDMGSPVYSRAIDGVYLPPEVIQAYVLSKLRAEIVRAVGPDAAVVITVPAFFDEPRRRATAVAGEIAGLQLLDIVNEPTAAALAFGEHLGLVGPGGAFRGSMKILVYDLGGGTFDVTLLQVHQGGFRTIATDGDVQLGGRDWDMRLVDLASRDFIKKSREDPRENPASLQRLLTEVERAKHTLSARRHATVRVDHAGSSLEVNVSRQAFEEATADLLDRTRSTTGELLAAGGLEWKDVSRILLVGGSTRMPMVSKMLEDLSGMAPDYVVSPDEAVARGAAIYAKYLLDLTEGGPLQPKYRITNVNAHSLGVEGIEQETLEGVNSILIPRNTPLPAGKTKAFVTKMNNQQTIKIQVLEGESTVPSQCTAIGRTVIKDLPTNLPQGHPVEVTFEYGTNGRLKVRAEVPGTDREVGLEIQRAEALSESWIPKWKQVVCGNGGFAALKAMAQSDLPSAASTHTWTTRSGSAAGGATALGPDQGAAEREDDLAGAEQTEAAPAQSAPAEEAAAPEARSAPTAPVATLKRRKRRRRSVPAEIVKWVLGGVLGLVLGQYFIWWFFPLDRCDPLGIGEKMRGSPCEFLLPDRVLKQLKARKILNRKGNYMTTDGEAQAGADVRWGMK